MTPTEPTRSRALLYLGVALAFTWLATELFSYGVIYAYYTATASRHPAEAHTERMARLGSFLKHPLWAGFPKAAGPPTYPYAPYISHRLRANGAMPPLTTDGYGFIHNGDPVRTLTTSDDTVRIVLLGGSSMMGAGATRNDQTIGGHLERLLNSGEDKHRYQVINAGVGGFYSPLEAVYLLTELVHYRPHVVMALDGFNDFWHAYPPSKDSADDGDWSIPNRSAEQQGHLNAALGVVKPDPVALLTQPSLLTRLFRFTTYALSHVAARFAPKDGRSDAPDLPFGSDPWRDNARWLREQVHHTPSHAPFMAANWRGVIGVAQAHGMKVALFFQPFYPLTSHAPTPEEQTSIDAFFKERSWIDREDYTRFARSFHQEMRAEMAKLQRQYQGNGGVHVEDLAGVMDGRTERVFTDVVHYSDQGNAVLAEHFAAIVRHLLKSSGEGAR